MLKVSILSIALSVLFLGCGEKDEPKTLEYYKDHISEAKVRVAECKKIGAAKENVRIDCINASTAVNQYATENNRPIIGDERQVADW